MSVIIDGVADPPSITVEQSVPVRCICEYHPAGVDALPLAAGVGYVLLLLGVALACYAAGRLKRIRQRVRLT